MKAYLISKNNGTIQIGNTLYQLPTGKSFIVSRKGLRGFPYVEVKDKSMTSAREAYQKLLNKIEGR